MLCRRSTDAFQVPLFTKIQANPPCFDLYNLRTSKVKDAQLTFVTNKGMGKPFDKMTGLGGLHIYEVRYEPGQLPGFSTKEYHELAPPIMQ